jgi:hypothetical protein
MDGLTATRWRRSNAMAMDSSVDEHAKLKTNQGDPQNITRDAQNIIDPQNITRDAQNITDPQNIKYYT